MKRRKLGASDLWVSEIALGSWLTYEGGIDEKRAAACIGRALDEGINLFDTANAYGAGRAEELLGRVLAGVPRDSYLLATKLFFPMSPADRGLSRAQIHKQLEASLRRLQTDHVDLYQCHRFDPETPLEETMQALTEVVEQGKVRYVGFSEWPADQIRLARQLPNVVRFVSSQPQYSLLWRAPEPTIIPLCREQEISQLVWSPLMQGILTGKYRSDAPPPADSRAADPQMGAFLPKALLSARVLDLVARLQSIAAAVEMSLPQLALAWVLREPNVAAAIVGATRPEQVAENAAASGRTLTPAVLRALDEAITGGASAQRTP